MLVWYSTTLKKKLLIGNILVSFLTSWVIVVIIFSLFQLEHFTVGVDAEYKGLFAKLFRIGILYAVFAFIISLIREVVKDMEDYLGDAKYGCKTMPIVWGFSVSKVFVSICTLVLIVLLLVLQFYVLAFEWYGAIIYCMLAIVLPLLFSMKLLFAAQQSVHFHMLSSTYKVIMLTGILSMVFFKIYG
jgi:4-hydroxybenzoate polyprenyltransferase